MESEYPSKEGWELPFEFVRPTETYETMFHLFHTLGIQSNILVGARYKYSKPGNGLTQAILFKALKSVINEHPALGIIGILRDSEKKKGNHRLWEARLRDIDLRECVVFVDDQNLDLERDLGRLVEEAHNHYEWFNTGDVGKPWWRLLVYNRSLAIFVYHHSIGDGKSGYAFHRSLLAALNQTKSEPEPTDDENSESSIVKTSTKKLTPFTHSQLDDKIIWIPFIYNFLFWIILRAIFSTKHFFFSDTKFSKQFPTLKKPFPAENRTLSKVQILRIDASTMKKCISACRANRTTFGALLQMLIEITLATDIYPQAKIGFSMQPVDIRHLCRKDLGPNVFANASSSYICTHWLGKFRAAGQTFPNNEGKYLDSKKIDGSVRMGVNSEAVWKLAVEYKGDLNRHMDTRTVIQSSISGSRFMGKDEDEVVAAFNGLALFQNNSFCVSNLGVFRKESMGEWTIDDVVFSAGATKASVGCAGLLFNVATVEGGDCVICTVYEQGVITDQIAKRTLDGVEMRLKALLQ